MKKNVLVLAFCLVYITGFSQRLPNNIGLSVGKVFRADMLGNSVSGPYLAVSTDRPLVRNWLSLTGRLAGFRASGQLAVADFKEISNGLNLDFDVNFILPLSKFRGAFFIGPSLRYGREQHVLGLSNRYGEVSILDSYDVRKLFLGFNFGASLDYAIHEKVTIGARYGGTDYALVNNHGKSNNQWAMVVKLRR
ncbi:MULTISPECIES: hypothetical protein [unclassified Imperialibacter]|uniref:hypothetical protein n=1 Tax=unclassified Imperialibacter TaxID=2629706 RepID=UPI00125EE3AF|nr:MULTISPECIES: hypothetical protein [unclassified Imperialibacter]